MNMNLAKRILSLVLMLALLMGNSPAVAFATDETTAATEEVVVETSTPTEAEDETAATELVTEPATIGNPEANHTHSYKAAVTSPTCTEQGYTTYTCICGNSYVDDYVDTTGHTYENGICTGCGETVEIISMRYDDHMDMTGKTVEIIDAGKPTSYQVGYGVEENTVLDTAVVTLEGNTLVATGIGTAKVKIDGILYEVTVEAAPISLLLLIGQSNMRGSEGNANQSIVCPDGMVYSTYGDDRGESNTAMTASNATQFAPSALTGTYSSINVVGTTDCLSGYPVTSLTEDGAGKIGPDSGFGYEWVKQTGEKVWVVNAAHGGTSINVWQPGTTEYEQCQALFTACQETLRKEIAAGHFTLSHMAYFWCQGCSDRTQSAQWYVNKYLAMHSGLKTEMSFDHDSNADTADKTFEFGGIIPVRVGSTAACYRDGAYETTNTYAYHESYVDLRFSGPRVAQYWMCNNPELEDIWMVCNIGEDWVWMPDGTNGVSEYFQSHYPNGTVDYTTQVKQSASWYTPTTPKAVHDSVHYNQIGYNEVGRESARNALIMLGENEAPEVETTVELLSWDGYTEVPEILASTAGNSGTLIVPKVYPVWKAKEVTYELSEGLTWNYYDLLATDIQIGGTLSVSGKTVTVEKATPGAHYVDHLSDLPEGVCCGVNLWNILAHDKEFFTYGTHWTIHSSGNVYSVTFPVKPGDLIYATAFGKAGENGSTSTNGIRVTFFNEYGVAKTTDPAGTYKEFVANGGYLIVPEGTTAANIPMWTNDSSNELYILNREHTYTPTVTAPTCTEQGYTTYTCSCGDSYADDYVDATGHSYENGICTSCGATVSPYLQQLPEKIIGCTNLYDSLAPVKGYYTATKYDTSNGNVLSVVIPVEPGDRIAASSFGPVSENMGSVNGIRVTYLLGNEIVSSLSPGDVYSGYTTNGYITVPNGVDTVCVPWWKPSDSNWLTLSQSSKDFAVHIPKTVSAQAPTCTERGYTAGEICEICNVSLGEREEIPATGHSYSGDTCTVCGTVNLLAFLDGKYISILGDSISTFNGYSNNAAANTTIGGNSPRYDAGTADTKPGSYCLLESVDDTWWMHFANRSGMKLLVNNSWAGSQVFGGQTSDGRVIPAAYLDRCVNLHDNTLENNPDNTPINPDVIFVYLGINDYNFNRSKVGTGAVDYAGLVNSDGTYVTPETFGEAYGIMLHKMCNAYPDAQIFAMTLLPENLYSVDKTAWEQHNAYIRAAAEYYDIPVVDLAENCAITWENYSGYMMDKIHPTTAGMKLISDCIEAELAAYYTDDQSHTHTYENGICTACGAEHPNLADYEGKVISILSASTSTFAGYIPVADGFNLEHRSRYPQDNLLTDVNETWWMQVINELDAKLGINDSWAGSTVSNFQDTNSGDLGPDAAMASLTRIQNLGANGSPDVILFFGAGNDMGRGVTLGSFDPATAPTEVDLTATKWDSFADAYVAAIMRLQHFYPDAEIVVMTTYAMPSYVTAAKLNKYGPIIESICDHYGVKYVDLRDCGVTFDMLPDGIHPNAEGMDYITADVLDALISDVEMEAEENVVHSVTHNLTNAASSLHYYKGVSHGRPFKTTLTGEDLTVTVTMDSVDVTAKVYANGVITIPEVTGDLVITAKAKFNADGHLQKLPEKLCPGVNLWTALNPENIYYTATGWGNTTVGTTWSITFPVQPGDRIWATSLGKAPENGSSANGVRVTWFDENGVLVTLDRNTVYSEFAKHGYITAPAGAVALNLPMTDNQDHYAVYILTAEHNYESVVTSPTCTEQGHSTHTCACGDSYVDSYVDALGHDMAQWETTQEATCTADGSKQSDCTRCDYFETEAIEAKGHTEVIDHAVAPTCTETGLTEGKHCSACEKVLVAQSVVAVLGHEISNWVVTEAPACTETGSQRRDCSRCDYFEEEVIQAKGHEYESVVTAPTCTEQGYTTYTCACGDSYVDDYVDATGEHSYENSICMGCGKSILCEAEFPVDLFVFAGQSNMMGAAVLEPEVDSFTDQAWEYKYMPKLRGAETGSFVPAQNSAGEWYYNDLNAAYGENLYDLTYQSSLSNYSENTYFCPAMSNGTKGFSAQSEANMYPSASLPPYFATEYASYGHSSIYAHMAKGSVKIIHYFTPDMINAYNALITAYNAENNKSYKLLTAADLTGAGNAFDAKYAAMLEDYATCAPDGSINNKCFVWLQGESDGSSYIEYKLKMQVLWEHLQTLGFTHFFVLRVGYWGSTGILDIIKAQEDFCAENENCYIVTRAPSLIPHPSATTDNWWIIEPDAEYADCRDSYTVAGSGNHHFNEKAMQIFAERSADNIHRILYQGLDPILENENIQGMLAEDKPEVDQPEDTSLYSSYVGTEAFYKGLSISKSSDKWVEKSSSTAASTDLIPVASSDSVWIQYVFFLSEAHAVGGFYDKNGELVAPLYYRDFGFSLGGGGGTAAFRTPEATNRISIADIELVTGKEIAFVRFTAWQASAGGHANTEARVYHDYEAVVTTPTCTEQGYTTYTCACGDSYVDSYVDALGHDMAQWETTQEATCTADGSKQSDCTRCDYFETEAIEAKGHTEVIDHAVAPTCTETGLTEGKHCSACEKVLVAQSVVAVLGHEISNWVVTEAPACTETGSQRRDCSRCDYFEEEVIQAKGHEYESVVTAPTCTEQGYTTYTCACGESYVDDYTDELGHYHATAERLESGEHLVLSDLNVIKNYKAMIFRADVDNLGDGAICLNHGKGAYGGSHLEITKDSLIIYNTTASVSSKTYSHGLHIDGTVKVRIDTDRSSTTVTITTESGTYRKSVSWSGCNGALECSVTNAALNNVDLRWYTTSMDSDAWFFGDSWFSTSSNARWTKYLLDDGYDVLLAGYPGMGAPAGSKQFRSLLELDKPEYAVWALGMNNGDRNGNINTSWQSATEEFLALCEEYGITPILCTIPTTPKVNNRLKNEWIVNSGYRYIDFDLAVVENHTTGEWFEGMAATDLNHPTTLGAQALYPQVFADFPELAKADSNSCQHKMHLMAARNAECENGGRKEYYVCSLCGGAYADAAATTKVTGAEMKLAPNGHSFGAWTQTKAPTCTAKGTERRECANCNHYETREIAAKGHTEVIDKAAAATCTATGLTEGKHCSVCSTITIKQNIVPALGHTEVIDKAVAATCTTTGLTEGKHCSVCEKVLVAQSVVAVLGHEMSNWGITEAPTCTETGSQRRDCNRCDYFEEEVLQAKGHEYGSVVTSPTCTDQGYTTHTCTCGDSYADTYVTALGHDMSDWVTVYEPTCTEDGSNRRDCSRCEHFETETISATGHSHNAVVTYPTCTADGFTTHTCHCGDTYTDSPVLALGHDMSNWVVIRDAACTEDGKQCRECGRCDHAETEVIEALGHSEIVDGAVAPTCTETGLTEGVHCTTCGEVLAQQEMIAALGHSWIDSSAVIKNCGRCGHTEGGYRLLLDADEFSAADCVWIDGVEYTLTATDGNYYIDLEHTNATNLVVYTYNDPDAQDIHTQYPTEMKVWILKYQDGIYTAKYIEELDNLLQYSGSSIRITGNKGIRMITSIAKNNKQALTGTGLAGYTLVEYGTALAWASDVESGSGLILGQEYTKSNYAYKKGVADPVFAATNDLIQYTNVLVGFSDDQCTPDIAMRPYIILEDAEGNQITLYGGTIYRSIGYVAYQNRNVVRAGTAAYSFVWDIIHHVYGDRYDSDYKG